jgi:hypothetical protein
MARIRCRLLEPALMGELSFAEDSIAEIGFRADDCAPILHLPEHQVFPHTAADTSHDHIPFDLCHGSMLLCCPIILPIYWL